MTATKAATILTNSFHNTSYRTTKTREELDAIADRVDAHKSPSDADKRFVRRVRNALCGYEGCQCGQNIYGER